MYIHGKFVITVDVEGGGYKDNVYERAICEIISVELIEGEAVAKLMIYGDESREVKVIEIGATTDVFEYDTRESIERRLLQSTIDNVCFGMVFDGEEIEEGS